MSGRAGTGRIVCIVSGGNIDAVRLAAILEGRVPL
jgi:threonine dehydratase